MKDSEGKLMRDKKTTISTMLVIILSFVLLTGCSGSSSSAPSTTSAAAATIAVTADTAATATPSPGVTVLPDTELMVSAAASLTDVLTALAADFNTTQPNVSVLLNFGSSGELQQQIESGAPADLFLSASTKQMDALKNEDLMDNISILNLLNNEVVLIVPSGSSAGITSFPDTATDKVTTLAVGDPESVPAGQYAAEVFSFLGIADAVSAKTVLCKDVRQVLTYVETGEADAGIVYATDAYSSKGVAIAAQAPEGSLETIVYPAGIVKATTHREAAQAFLDYLTTPAAAAIFTSCGFTMAG